MNSEIEAPRLVENSTRHWGRFRNTPIANPSDEFTGWRKKLEDFRTKEWAGFTLIHPDLYCAMILNNAKYLRNSEIHVVDRATNEMTNHASVGADFTLSSDLLHSQVDYKAKGYNIRYDFSDSKVHIHIQIDATPNAKSIHGAITLDPDRKSPPLVVSAKLPSGKMYTNKIVYPASGFLKVGDRRYEFTDSRDLAILDEHKSRLPFTTQWTWGTFALPVDGGIVGANFATRPQRAEQVEESGLWTPERVEPLANISFEPQGDSDLSPWRIRSADGRMEVFFTPEGRKTVKHNLAIVRIDYFQMYGTYQGTVRGANQSWTFDGVHGVCEKMWMRA